MEDQTHMLVVVYLLYSFIQYMSFANPTGQQGGYGGGQY